MYNNVKLIHFFVRKIPLNANLINIQSNNYIYVVSCLAMNVFLSFFFFVVKIYLPLNKDMRYNYINNNITKAVWIKHLFNSPYMYNRSLYIQAKIYNMKISRIIRNTNLNKEKIYAQK